MDLSLKAFEDRHAEFIADANYPRIEAIAKSKGYRKATALELYLNAHNQDRNADIFCAFGGCWVKLVAELAKEGGV